MRGRLEELSNTHGEIDDVYSAVVVRDVDPPAANQWTGYAS